MPRYTKSFGKLLAYGSIAFCDNIQVLVSFCQTLWLGGLCVALIVNISLTIVFLMKFSQIVCHEFE